VTAHDSRENIGGDAGGGSARVGLLGLQCSAGAPLLRAPRQLRANKQIEQIEIDWTRLPRKQVLTAWVPVAEPWVGGRELTLGGSVEKKLKRAPHAFLGADDESTLCAEALSFVPQSLVVTLSLQVQDQGGGGGGGSSSSSS
jgi:hypothetical protein